MAPVKDDDVLAAVDSESTSPREVTRDEVASRLSRPRTPPGIWPPMGAGALGRARRPK